MNLEGVTADFYKTALFTAAGKVMSTFLLQTSFWKDL